MNNQYLFNVKYYECLYKKNSDEASKRDKSTDNGRRFQRDKTSDSNDESIIKANKALQEYTLNPDYVPKFKGPANTHIFKMQTVYPGLLIGIGNPHSWGKSDNEIKLGFTLDYTTGLPYIPGSTIKGILRSVFAEADKKESDESEEHYNCRKDAYGNRMDYLKMVISEITSLDQSDEKLSDENLEALKNEIFAGINKNERKVSGDLFFDSYPIKGGAGNKLFAFESITPHNGIKNPKPLRLLKVIPEVVFEFRIAIYDSNVIPELTAANKETLFKRIITDFGLGAKTNVGFGVLEEYNG